MNPKSIRLTRRALLRGAGALLALPFLEGVAPLTALASGKAAVPPLRMGIFTVTGGTVLESWRPKETGPLTKLPSILRPLDFARNDVLVLSGLSHDGRSENLNGHEHCAMLHLTGTALAKKDRGKLTVGVSVDQAAAQAVGEETFLPSLEIGLTTHETMYSFRNPETPVPYEANPRLVFERMFRGRKPVVPNWSRRATLPAEAKAQVKSDSYEQSVVDLVLEDAANLRRQLGRDDQHRLDDYLHSVRSVEKRVQSAETRQRLEATDALQPGPSKITLPDNLPAEGVPIWKITNPVHRNPDRHAEYLRLMADLMVLAFQTDTTRVATFAAGSDEAMFPGVVTVGYERHCHTLEHQGNSGRVEDADPIAREGLRQIHEWYTVLFAEMVRKMKDIDEGGSTLLDNSMILYTSYMADGGHGCNDYPVLLAGRAGGTLKPGRHVAYKKETPMANLYVEMLNRMGAKTEAFGVSRSSKRAGYEGRLPDLQ